MSFLNRRSTAVLTFILVASRAEAEESPREVDRASLETLALREHPAVRSTEQRARAIEKSGAAEDSLPPPEAMLQIWGVPITKPYAVGDAQMIMLGVGQTFPAPGSRGARGRAADAEAEVERTTGQDIARQIRRDIDHAYADYVEATARHRVHQEHRRVARRTLDLATARHAGGGSLNDVAQAEVELARMEADVVTDATRIEAARARINALVGRDATASLGPPVVGDPETTALDAKTALAKARETRPELRARAASTRARREEATAAEKEALLPSFTVAALYFAPTSVTPQHGYGANASMTLPWLWGEARARRDARRESVAAAESELAAQQRPIEAEVATAEASVRASTVRLQTLRDRALPASRRAFDVAWAGYESGRIDVLTVVAARRSVVDVESEIVASRAAVDHALADLDAAVGASVPRKPIGPLDPGVLSGADHGD